MAERSHEIYGLHNTLIVVVGSSEESFELVPDAVCASSKFFEAECSRELGEGQRRTVRLPEVDPDTFRTYCNWLYKRHDLAVSPTGDDEQDCPNACELGSRCVEQNRLLELYLLGQTLDDVQLRNRSLAKFGESMMAADFMPCVGTLNRIWASLMPQYQMRNMITYVFIARCVGSEFRQTMALWPAELVQEMAAALLEERKQVPVGKTKKQLSRFQEPGKAE